MFGEALGANPTVSFLGSFGGKWSADYTCGDSISAHFTVTNSTDLTSGTRFPVIGYEQVTTPSGPQPRPSVQDWMTTPLETYESMGGLAVPGSLLEPRAAGTPMGSVKQRFEWSEELPIVCPPGSATSAAVFRHALSPLDVTAAGDPLEIEAEDMARRALSRGPD
jgi:hypothetical protein